MKNTLVILILFIGLTSCEKLIMKPNPSTGNKAVFSEYSTLVKEKYAMLDFKGVDIDHLIDSISPLINDEMGKEELFKNASIITTRLRDGHSSLIAIEEDFFSFADFDLHKGYPVAFNDTILTDNYLHSNVSPSLKHFEYSDEQGITNVNYGYLAQSETIAYVRIPSFNVEIPDEDIETMFMEINSSAGLILDVRGNGGGDPSLSTKVASYFMNNETYTGFERFKTGPELDDFSDSESIVTPAESNYRYVKPIVVLTDRGCYSATTTLAYNMNPLSHVTFMGQRTGGGSGSVADGYLSNGWQWSLSTSEFIDHLGNHLDDGIDPDIAVDFDNSDLTKDEFIEEALVFLGN